MQRSKSPAASRAEFAPNPMAVEYKVVEIANVTEEEIEAVLNEWTAQGWTFDTLQFAMRDSSRRPSMAFATFTRPTSISRAEG